jgi:hypothetical protein
VPLRATRARRLLRAGTAEIVYFEYQRRRGRLHKGRQRPSCLGAIEGAGTIFVPSPLTKSRRNRHSGKPRSRSRPVAQITPPAVQLAGVDTRRARHLRRNRPTLERRRNNPLFLGNWSAPAALNRRDHLNPTVRHMTIPRSSHRTLPSALSTARRPSPEGYTSECSRVAAAALAQAFVLRTVVRGFRCQGGLTDGY